MKDHSLQARLSGPPLSVAHIFNWLSVQHSLPNEGHIPLTVAICNKAPVRTFSSHLELLKEYLGTVQAGNVSIFAGLACCNIKVEKSTGHTAHLHARFAEMGINADFGM